MASRQDVVNVARGALGYHTQGQGYDERCIPSATYLGPAYGDTHEGGWGPDNTPVLAWCDVFISWCFRQAGIPLPNMGGMISEGQQYCPSSLAWAQAHGAVRANQADAQPGDQVIFNWNGNWTPIGPASHTELVVANSGGWLTTIGGNSGPAGGVNQHAWQLPNSLIQGVIDTSQLVQFSDSEEFVMDAEARAAFADLKQTMQQLVTVIEGGLDPKKNPFGIVGLRDISVQLKKIAAKVGA
jgi:hypothetical protein